jgi:hypothetical protein
VLLFLHVRIFFQWVYRMPRSFHSNLASLWNVGFLPYYFME